MNFMGSLLGSVQYVGIRLGRAGHSGQMEAAWEVEGCLLRRKFFPFFQKFVLVRCSIVGLPLQVACRCF